MKLTMCDDDGTPMVSKEIPDPVEIPLMSLRDYFAAAAIAGMMANDAILQRMVEAEDVAHHAFGIADAMLEARSR